MAYNGSSGKRLCTGTDLDVERVSVDCLSAIVKFVSCPDENGRVLYISRWLFVVGRRYRVGALMYLLF